MNADGHFRPGAGAVRALLAGALMALAGGAKPAGGGPSPFISQAEAEKAVRERFDIDHYLTVIPKRLSEASSSSGM